MKVLIGEPEAIVVLQDQVALSIRAIMEMVAVIHQEEWVAIVQTGVQVAMKAEVAVDILMNRII